ncbi:hypothetical protein LshimejAT787_1200580 [Lyophyllum shimeji]|uniref:Uncharacterized protein n=1 Tax=Lyophyllum shimeji TaxID=47721 RepID=A0A9P3UPC9_LYOSH|nr:hypothetical protein LshimejAT787_1200580 [Lyophyllum shimeji]
MPDGPSLSASGPHGMQLSSRPPFSPPYFSKRSVSPEATFAHHPPAAASAYSLPLPPPYALQPSPQWDRPTFPPALRSSADSLSWSRRESRSASGSLTPPTHLARIRSPPLVGDRRDEPEAVHAEAVPPQRTGRYDPVRATFVYTTPSPEASGSSRRTDTHEEAQDDRPPTHP